MESLLATLILFLASSAAFAEEAPAVPETFEGEIAAVAPEQNVFSVTTNPGSEEPDVRVLTDEATRFVGVESLGELQLGDKVEIAAVEDPATNSWDAENITLEERPEEDPALAIAREVINDETIRGDRSSLARTGTEPRAETERAPRPAEVNPENAVPAAASPAPENAPEDTPEDIRPEEGGPPRRPTGDDQRNFSR